MTIQKYLLFRSDSVMNEVDSNNLIKKGEGIVKDDYQEVYSAALIFLNNSESDLTENNL